MTLPQKMREAAASVKEAESEPVPEAPAPDADNATAGTEAGQAMAACYLPNCVRLFAGVAFGKGSRAKLHTRTVAAGHLVKIAAGMGEEAPGPDEG